MELPVFSVTPDKTVLCPNQSQLITVEGHCRRYAVQDARSPAYLGWHLISVACGVFQDVCCCGVYTHSNLIVHTCIECSVSVCMYCTYIGVCSYVHTYVHVCACVCFMSALLLCAPV